MDVDIRVSPFNPELAEGYLRLLPGQGDKISKGRLRWRFCDNPAAGSVFAVARNQSDGKLIGLNAFLALRLQRIGQTVTVHQSIDTIVDPVCRGQGLFPRLLQSYYTASAQLGVPLLYGFPNSNSAPGFFNKLSWTRLGSVPFLVKPLRTGYFASRVLGEFARGLDVPLALRRAVDSTDCVDLAQFDERADELWRKFSANVRCALVRDATYLNWRITRHPETRYTTKAIISSDGVLRAFITYVHLEKHGGRIGYVMEALALPGANADLIKLFVIMQNEFLTARVDAILAWCLPHSPNRGAYRCAGFYSLPDRLRPIQLHFGARSLAGAGEPAGAIGLNQEDWYISYLDSDTV